MLSAPTNAPAQFGHTAPIDAKTDQTATPESFVYLPTTNRDLRVTVDQVLAHGDKEYLPKDGNWLQAHVVVTNVGQRVVTLSTMKVKLASGTVVAAAASSAALAKPPSFAGVAGRTIGAGVAGQVLGTMIFPPLSLFASGAGLFGVGSGWWNKRMKQINASSLAMADLSPGTSVSGYVYLPAGTDQVALIAFYAAGLELESITIPRKRVDTAIALSGESDPERETPK